MTHVSATPLRTVSPRKQLIVCILPHNALRDANHNAFFMLAFLLVIFDITIEISSATLFE
jgi:hypothetical protein